MLEHSDRSVSCVCSVIYSLDLFNFIFLYTENVMVTTETIIDLTKLIAQPHQIENKLRELGMPISTC